MIIKQYDEDELIRAKADRDYWRSFIKNDDWQLLGWTFRDAATFVNNRQSLELNSNHIDMLQLLKGED
jgi:hypothetical protein